MTLSAPVFTYRSEMTDSAVRKEFEQLYASLRTVLHNLTVAIPSPPPDGGTTPTPGGGMDLDYLGDYHPGIYNDGDIVIGSDGIAYMCVVDGTTTPPEPWPGVGVAGIIADAQYWVSTAHPNLSQERDIGALANGYVYSTVAAGVSTPSTVAIIPISQGGTGASDPPNARTNLGLGTMAVQNANAVSITGGSLVGDIGISVTQSIGTTLGVHAGYFVGDGSNLTNLNASSLATGTVATARLGSGTADASTFLRGDQTWQTTQSIFPSGLIVLSLAPCPPGWTRITVWDDLFLRVGATPNVGGGTWTHNHGTHTHSAGTYQAVAHDHGGSVNVSISGNTGNAGGHSHGFSGVSGTTEQPDLAIFFNNGTGANLSAARTDHRHNFSVGGNTDGVGDHQHSFSGSGSGTLTIQAPGVTGDSSAAGVAEASHIPPFVYVYACQKL